VIKEHFANYFFHMVRNQGDPTDSADPGMHLPMLPLVPGTLLDRKRVPDTQLAATLHQTGVDRIII
jgi:hypothetical protein